MYTHQFITERRYLKGSQATIQWYHSRFKALEGALDSKQAIIERIGTTNSRNHSAAVALYYFAYNFIKIHGTLPARPPWPLASLTGCGKCRTWWDC